MLERRGRGESREGEQPPPTIATTPIGKSLCIQILYANIKPS